MNEYECKMVSHEDLEKNCAAERESYLYDWTARIHVSAVRSQIKQYGFDIISYRARGYCLVKKEQKKEIPSQNQLLKNYFDSGKTITRREAILNLGIANLTARLSDLRQQGYPLKTTITKGINRHGASVRYAIWSKQGSKA